MENLNQTATTQGQKEKRLKDSGAWQLSLSRAVWAEGPIRTNEQLSAQLQGAL